MGKPLNMNPEDYARQIVAEQQARIDELEAQIDEGGGGATSKVVEYSFSANTAEPPSVNQARLNAAAASATKLWLDKLSSDGIDIMNAITQYQAGDRVFIQDKNDATRYARYMLAAAPILRTGYAELPLAFLDLAGSLNGGQPVMISLAPA